MNILLNIHHSVENYVENTLKKVDFNIIRILSLYLSILKIKEFMFGSLIKKKLTDNQVANIFINALFDSVDNGFSIIAQWINEDPAFTESPKIDIANNSEFALIVIVGNLSLLESTFETGQAERVEKLIYEKLAKIYEISELDIRNIIKEYRSFINRINMPSKNMIYGMSKAVFFKYNLNEYQDDYFKRMQVPNPLFLKRMDEIMGNYLWNWDAFFKKFKL